MEIKEFAESVRAELERITRREVTIHEVTKNNGVIMHGINIIEPDINVIPTIYVENYVDDFKKGRRLEEIACCIYATFIKERVTQHLDMNWFRDFEKVRGKVAYKLINFEANRELLEQIPYEKVLDLVKVYYVSVDTKELGKGTILIYNNHLDLWGISAEELREIAEENTPKLFPAEIMWMGDILEEYYNNVNEETVKELEELEKVCPMYVMSNAERVFGAATMYYTDAVKRFAEQMDSDIYIIPSSTHEIIMLAKMSEPDIERLKEMVYEVNRTQIVKEELLSDSVYIYSRKTNSIDIA